MERHLRARRSAAFALSCAVAAACAVGLGERGRFVETILAERAEHLDRATRRTIARAMLGAERLHDVDAFLLLAVAERESHFRPGVRSRRGARGLMQIRPETASAVARRHGIPWTGAHDLDRPEIGVAVAAAYLAELHEEFGEWDAALAAYHRGPTRLRRGLRRGIPLRSRYARGVLALTEEHRERFRALRGEDDEEEANP